jgi:glycosyltransferase involved in cell wall biosynthesis
MEPKRYSVAIIIPAYNAEQTLKNTVESVLAQTLQNMQIIIVDDGSSDNTPVIADEFGANESRVTVIHQENRGGYAARLAGLKVMNASYFGFVDADDTIDPKMYETLLNYAVQHNLDIVQCGVVGRRDNDQTFEILDEDAFKERIVRKILLQGGGAVLVWDKLYRNQYEFDKFADGDFVQWDDLALNLYFFQNVHAFGIIHKGFYSYNTRNETSVTRRYNPLTLHWYHEIIKWRRSVSAIAFNMSEYDDAIWIMRTARNLFVMMSYVKFPSWRKRYTSVCQLVQAPEVVQAYSFLRHDLSILSKMGGFWFLATRCTCFLVMLIFGIKRILRYRR